MIDAMKFMQCFFSVHGVIISACRYNCIKSIGYKLQG